MASREIPNVEVHEEVDDATRPGLRWFRDWWPEDDESGEWSGELGVRCTDTHRPYGWVEWRPFTDTKEEQRARAQLEALADAHLLEAHPQLSLFETGCGCR